MYHLVRGRCIAQTKIKASPYVLLARFATMDDEMRAASRSPAAMHI